MSLKYLFFPLVLVISAVVFWAYVWPEFVSFRTANAGYKLSQQNLQSIYEKKSALESLSSQLKGNSENSAMVLSYVPKDRSEEKIIGQVNYLASNSGVFLSDIAVARKPDQGSILANQGSFPATKNSNAADELSLKKNDSEFLKNTQVTIKVGGDYDKLKTFFKGIQHMPLLNSIRSLSITSKEKVQANPGASGDAVAEKLVNLIEAELIVDFGYLDQITADDDKLANFKTEIDNKAMQELKDYTAGVVPKINTSDISTGKDNPFLP